VILRSCKIRRQPAILALMGIFLICMGYNVGMGKSISYRLVKAQKFSFFLLS
jgi:hypothetical protein